MYDHQTIEKKWQDYWLKEKTFETDVWDFSKPKYYILDMFPYPSGKGLHVGHPEGYTATDIIARKKRMEGYNVLHPMGFDSFGLPAEQFAIQTGNHPSIFTNNNIDHFREQIQSLGFSYDWQRELATSNPDYYKWTQWIFSQLYKNGLAYMDEIPVNWCPDLKAVLANEEVIDGKSERGGYPVIRKPMRQWVLRITDYADKLLEGLDEVDWPNSTKEMQRNWIGKSQGANVDFKVDGTDEKFTVFTTRPDTLFGATYCVLAPEHELVKKIMDPSKKEEIEAYLAECIKKSDLQRTDLNKDKTGVFIGAYAVNPVNGKKIPIFISDYVLASYGTGAIMAVPAHDQRDYDFAKKFDLEIIPVVEGDISQSAFTADGLHINSSFLDGLNKEDAIAKMIEWLEENESGKAQTTYKLRDWLFSRQRYWGEPIPIVHMEDGTMQVLDDSQLPLELPMTDQFVPADNGESPLANCSEWLEVEIDGKKGKRETNTMPQWAGSCWYYIRYLDPKNDQALADPELMNHWLPVDLYVGGAEHAVLHLLYSRFWHKFLHDQGVLEASEPFAKLFHQGMILGENGEKMAKSKGNVVNPDKIVESHGADALRVYEMFMGPLEASLPWSETGLDGTRRWLERVWRFFNEVAEISDENDHKLDKVYHQTVKKVSEDIDTLNFNTAISQMMIFINEAYKNKTIYKPYAEGFIKLLSVFAPHLGEELWQKIFGHTDTIAYEPWPEYDETLLIEEEKTIIVQINGKVRARFQAPVDSSKEWLEEKAMELEPIKKAIDGKTIRKVIVVPNKLVNIVV